MRVDILDNDLFSSLAPSEVERYLTAAQWREVHREEETVSIWEHSDVSNGKYRVWLPLNAEFADYGTAVGRLIKTLALAEDRSQLQILEDLNTVAVGDVIRASTWDELDRTSSTIPIVDGLFLLRRVYGMARSAASATVEKKPVFPSRSSNQVVEYLQHLRLGQTERGSYLVKLISPIPPPKPLVDRLFADEPFGRQVVISLVKSLTALQRTAGDAYRRGRFVFEPFQESVPEGVSANLCEAVAGTDEEESHFRPLEISISWSYALAAPTDAITRTIPFGTNLMPYIAEAARKFRELNPQIIALRGYVTVLHRDPGGPPGDIRIVGPVDGKTRSVRVTLEKPDYDIAIAAHQNQFEIACEGTLAKEGPYYVLHEPRNFRISRGPYSDFEQLTLMPE